MHEIAEVVEEVTDIAKIVRKKIRFWILQMKPLKSWTCKECEKNVTNLQMKTHIRDNHAEYWKFETIGGLFQIKVGKYYEGIAFQIREGIRNTRVPPPIGV